MYIIKHRSKKEKGLFPSETALPYVFFLYRSVGRSITPRSDAAAARRLP